MTAEGMERTYEALRLRLDGRVATITLARPEALNALSLQLKADLADAIAVVASDERARTVILTGEGRAFCAGGDIKEMSAGRRAFEDRERMLSVLETIAIPLARMPKPVIAAVNGHAHGAGLSLALCTDLIIAAEDATFSLAFVRVGLIPDVCALYFLPRIVGFTRAKELMFTGCQLTAQEARDLGLVNRVVANDSLAGAATELAQSLSEGPRLAYALGKRLLDQSLHVSLEDMAQLEAYAQAVAFSTPDHAQAAAVFREKGASD